MRHLIVLVFALAAPSLPAQAPTARDSAFVARTRMDMDTLARDKSAPQYSKRAQTRIRARMDTLLRGAVTPAPTPPPAPVASFVVVCGTNLTCAFNAGASTGARIAYQWQSCGALPDCSPGNVPAFSFQYPHEGPRTARLTVRDSLGRTAAASRTFTVPAPVVVPVDSVVTPPPPADTTVTLATPPELPRSVPPALPASTGTTIRVGVGGDLQAALNTAQPGQTIALARGATWIGNFTIPGTACGAGTITLRTDIPDSLLPPAGSRMTPTKAAALALAKILTPNTEAALRTAGPACNWRLLALDLSATPTAAPRGVRQNYGLLKLGDGGWVAGGDIQNTLALTPRNFSLERLYLHGHDSTNTSRCLALNSAETAVRDSWLDDCHGKGFDSQAIEMWNGPGPYLIENNTLAGAGENVMAGGADPGIVGLSPSDITIRRNHITKPVSWKGVWTVKNLLELKNARRVLVEGNVFENNWVDAQVGMAIVIKSTTDSCGTGCMWEGTTDVTFRWNVVRNSPRGLNLQAYDNSYVPTGTNVHVQRVLATNNLFTDIGAEGDAWLMLLTHDLKDIAITRNTFLHALSVGTTRGAAVMMDYGQGQARRLSITDNIFTAGAYEVFYSGGFVGSAALTQMAGTAWTFTRNAIVGGQYAGKYPVGNVFPATVPTTGGADLAELTRRTASVIVAP